MEFYEKPSFEDLEHYGVKGMKWGVRRFGRKLDRMNQKYNKTREKYKGKVITGYASQAQSDVNKMTRQQTRIRKFVKKNEELFNENISSLSKEQVESGKKWLEYANSGKNKQQTMRINELRTGWENVIKLNPKTMVTTSWDELYRMYDEDAKRWRN